MKDIYLVSGGLDSYLAYRLFGFIDNSGIPLFIDYGQKYADKEKKAVEKCFGGNVKYITIDKKIIEIENNYIPNRNLLLGTIAASYFNTNKIVIAGLKDDNCSDKTQDVFKEYSEILSRFSKRKIEVTSPFWDITKGEAINLYLQKGFNSEILKDTISCYSESEHRCGNCEACFRWWVALESCGINTGLCITDRIISEYIKKVHNYDRDRQNRILMVLKKYNYA